MLRKALRYLRFLWFWFRSLFRPKPKIILRHHVQARSPQRQLKLALRKRMPINSGRQWVKMRKALKRSGTLDIYKVPKTPVRRGK